MIPFAFTNWSYRVVSGPFSVQFGASLRSRTFHNGPPSLAREILVRDYIIYGRHIVLRVVVCPKD